MGCFSEVELSNPVAVEVEYDVILSEEELLASDEPDHHQQMLEQDTRNSLVVITHKQRPAPPLSSK